MKTPSALARLAVRHHLVKFPAAGTLFPGRNGGAGKSYLVDSRGAGASVSLRSIVMAALLERFFELEQPTAIAGVAKSGIMWGAWLARDVGIPFAVVLLDGPRTAGLQREVEGELAGKRVCLVDNWTKSGGSLVSAADIVERHGGTVVGALAISGRRPPHARFPIAFAFPASELLAAAVEQGLVPPNHPVE